MKIFLFGGTAEGHLLAERLAEAGNFVTCAVATEYGQAVLEPRDNLTVLVGRLTAGEMAERLEGFDVVVDATHPYADKVSENIRAAAEQTATPYYRLLRPRGRLRTSSGRTAPPTRRRSSKIFPATSCSPPAARI